MNPIPTVSIYTALGLPFRVRGRYAQLAMAGRGGYQTFVSRQRAVSQAEGG
jgi:hypothetical protein